jgi:deoxyuridine 5'-triphosphate nucleotidohydrolase
MEDNITYNESDMAETITYVYPPDDEPTAFCNSGLVDYDWCTFNSIPTIKFVKTHPDAVLPTSNHDSDTGYDVYAVEDTIIPARGKKVVPVGLEFAEIPEGFWIRVESRSGLSFKKSLVSFNGIIDSGYRGDAGILIYNNSDEDYQVTKGERVAQFVIYPLIKFPMEFTEKKQETERGSKGFGSSGK